MKLGAILCLQEDDEGSLAANWPPKFRKELSRNFSNHLIIHRLTGEDCKVVLHVGDRSISKEEETISCLAFILLTVSINANMLNIRILGHF